MVRKSEPQKQPGVGVDAYGGGLIDPTENVKALTEAANKRQDDLREENNRRFDAELKCIREVANLRAEHAKEIRELESDRLEKIRQVDVLAGNTAADRALVAIQTLATSQAAAAETLRAMVTSTAETIATQTTQSMAAVTERIAALEKSSYEGAGKQAVSDPMMAELVAEMKAMRISGAGSTGQSQGAKNLWGYIVGAIGLIAVLLAIADRLAG